VGTIPLNRFIYLTFVFSIDIGKVEVLVNCAPVFSADTPVNLAVMYRGFIFMGYTVATPHQLNGKRLQLLWKFVNTDLKTKKTCSCLET